MSDRPQARTCFNAISTAIVSSSHPTASRRPLDLASSTEDSDRSEFLPSEGQRHALIGVLGDSNTNAVSFFIEGRGGLLEVEFRSSDLIIRAHVGATACRDGADGVAAAGGLLVRVDDGCAGGGQESSSEGEELHGEGYIVG